MPEPPPRNLYIDRGSVSREDREAALGQRACVVWFTGLSGSGKSTLAREVERRLAARGRLVYVLDGDNVRHGLCADLGFSDADRAENIRRIAEVAALLVDAGLIVLTAFISPFRADRAHARRVIGGDRFVEVHVDATLAECESRDPKGLYAKARRGEIAQFTGIDSPYEPPENAEVTLKTATTDVAAAAAQVVDHLAARGRLQAPGASR
jgi:bifunctional enzyme CysN/CysC